MKDRDERDMKPQVREYGQPLEAGKVKEKKIVPSLQK